MSPSLWADLRLVLVQAALGIGSLSCSTIAATYQRWWMLAPAGVFFGGMLWVATRPVSDNEEKDETASCGDQDVPAVGTGPGQGQLPGPGAGPASLQ